MGASPPGDTEELGIGLLGYGYWGAKHARVLASMANVSLTIIEGDPHRRRLAAQSFPPARIAASLEEVQSDLDAVVIATPPRTHAPLALQALRAGLHALVEKPLATSVAAAEEMVAAAAAADRILMVGHTYRYNAGISQLKALITSGELGQILYIDTARLNLGLYQSDCNVIWDLLPHDIAIMSFLLGEFPDTVSVWGHRNLGGQYEDVAYVRLGFESCTGVMHASWLHPSKIRTVTVVGDRKMAVYNDMSDTERIRIYDKRVDLPVNGQPLPAMPATYRNGNIVSPYVEFSEPLMIQDSHFIECIRHGVQPRTPGEHGLEVVRVLDATDKAIAASEWSVAIERPTNSSQTETKSAIGKLTPSCE